MNRPIAESAAAYARHIEQPVDAPEVRNTRAHCRLRSPGNRQIARVKLTATAFSPHFIGQLRAIPFI
jgi:hypothetical protein